MIVSITKEQFSALEMLLQLGIYYIEDKEPSSSCYESDKEYVKKAQDVLKQIELYFL